MAGADVPRKKSPDDLEVTAGWKEEQSGRPQRLCRSCRGGPQQEAAEYTTIATKALKDAEEAAGSKAVQKARQLLEAEPSPRNAALALAERTMSATRAM